MKQTLFALLILSALACKKDDDCNGQATITLFNNIPETVSVTVDGTSFGSLPPGGTKEVVLDAGQRKITAHPSSGAASYNRTRTVTECKDEQFNLK